MGFEILTTRFLQFGESRLLWKYANETINHDILVKNVAEAHSNDISSY